MKKFLISSLIIITLFIISSISVFAQSEMPDNSVTNPNSDSSITNPKPTNNSVFPTLSNPLKANSVTELLFSVVDMAMFIGMIVAVLMFIWIGFKFVMAQGNDKALSEAKSWFLYAVIGTAVLISAKLIVSVVQNTLTSTGLVNESLLKK
jgi:Sec-independent protein secretion pathway component TatC